jgi:hypothetical protein
VTMHGTNVLAGIHALMDLGYMNTYTAIPHYIRDVTTSIATSHVLGGRNDAICVEYGHVVVSSGSDNNKRLDLV